MRKVVPDPGALCLTKSFPLWYSSMILFERLKPSPHPRFLVL